MYMPSGLSNFENVPQIIPRQHLFSPYANNGGTIAAIAGDNFAVIGSDTRISHNFSILSRNQCKLFQLNEHTVLGSAGCWCDSLTLMRVLYAQMDLYKQENHKCMTTPAAAQMLSMILYYKRFFPYYLSNILVGLDNNGKGCVFSYDPIGHCEQTMYEATGTGGSLIQPLLDNQIGMKNMLNAKQKPMTIKRAINILRDAFVSAAERDIFTGDKIIVRIVTKSGTCEKEYRLRKD